jgi:uncharacterized protein YihD (DUF1040 family)
MKSNWLIILLVIVASSTINLGSTLKYGNPSIEFIQNKEFDGKNRDVFIYSLKLRSNEKLVKFKVDPSIKGLNKDSEFNFLFEDNTHQAVVNYFYVLPEGIDSEEVVLTFTLTDSKESNVKTKVIKVTDDFSHFAKSQPENNSREI